VVHKVFFGPVSEAGETAHDPPAGMSTALILLMALSLFSTLFALPIVGRIVQG
jgi:NADH:ubiquinone oxidoreductase subunit 5 (subunit L)/multisubunit Na+/H+ antiporter MnhA subunit